LTQVNPLLEQSSENTQTFRNIAAMRQTTKVSSQLSSGLGTASEQVLIELHKDFSEARRLAAPPEALQELFLQALDFIRAHTQDEEAVMAAVAYPELNRHREEHQELMRRFSSVRAGLALGNADSCEEAETLLRTWIEDHYTGPDRHFHEYLVAFHLCRLRTGIGDASPTDTAAQAEEERFRAIVEAAPNAIVVVDENAVICVANSQVEMMFGYQRSELLGRPIEIVVPERLQAQHSVARTAFLAAPEVRAMGMGRDLFGRRKDGTEVPIEIGLSALHTAEGRFVLASIIDISKRKAVEHLLREAAADQLRESIIFSLPASVIATNTDGQIVTINPAGERLLGYTKEELVGQSVTLLHEQQELRHRAIDLSRQLHKDIAPDFQVIVAAGSRPVIDEHEWTYCRKDGTTVPVQIAITVLRDAAGKASGYLAVANDITARKQAEASLRHMADHDALTGLPNRALLADRLRMAMRQARRSKCQVSVLMLDLDQFKQVNDSLGHHLGDQLLLAVAERLRNSVREVDTVARLGGDEFVIVVNDVADLEDLSPLIAQIGKSVASPLRLDRHELHVTASIGGCLYPRDGHDVSTLLKKADSAMYQAKAAGRSTFRWFTETMMLESQEKLVLGNALRHAMERNEFALHLQPQLSLRTGLIIGAEALLRWRHGQKGDISPARFIPILEDTGLIVPVGEWVLHEACRQCVEMQRQLRRAITVAVNVSPRQFSEKHWVHIVKSALRKSGLNPNQLELEVTEGILMQSPEESAGVLHAIRALGVGIVIDDFGTGYSSLSYLTRFPIDKLKIDQSFVRDLATDTKDAAVVSAIIAMARKLNMQVVAEGVESLGQQNYLLAQDCDEAQGFFYSRGLPKDDLLAKFTDIEAAVDLEALRRASRAAN
jgi:diguanylate cyclase (GGDEF)-like protein/PAS domain S-box-containing protein/hemerythrin-like metal-binding protein